MKHIKLPALPLLLLLPLLLATSLSAQDYFQKTYDHFFTDRANALEVLPNGNIAVAGVTAAQSGSSQDIWIQMFNAQGEVLWSKTYTLSTQKTDATDIRRTHDGNLLITFDAFAANGEARAGWMKINPLGDVLWSKQALPSCRLTNITPIAGGYLLTGDYRISAVNRDALAVKVNESGDVVWFTIFGETGYEQLSGCWEDPQGLLYCSGYRNDGQGISQGLFVKLGANGSIPGAVQSFSNGSNVDLLGRVAPLGTDRLLLTGNSQGFLNGHARVWTIETDRDGVLKNSKTYALNNASIANTDLLALPGGQYLLSCTRPGSGLPGVLLKISSLGDILWENRYKSGGQEDLLWQVKPHGDGFVTVGTSTFGNQRDFFVVKTDRDGKAGDCCPEPAGLTRADVMPDIDSYVPTEKTGFSSQTIQITATSAASTPNTICSPIELEFTLADSILCPLECTEITLVGNTPGVSYSIAIQGGAFDPNDSTRICHTEGITLFVTRTGVSNNCEKTLTKSIEVGNKDDLFPNAFTPNGDNANDVFQPIYPCPVLLSNLKIYNRWGTKVFETSDPLSGWDGRIDNTDAPSDVYVWWLEYEAVREGTRQMFVEKGDVTLLR